MLELEAGLANEGEMDLGREIGLRPEGERAEPASDVSESARDLRIATPCFASDARGCQAALKD